MLHTLLLSRPNSEGSIVTESILISLEMCSANSPGWRTREAEFVTLAKVLAACSQMATMDMVAVCQFGYFMQFTVMWCGHFSLHVNSLSFTLCTCTLYISQIKTKQLGPKKQNFRRSQLNGKSYLTTRNLSTSMLSKDSNLELEVEGGK